MQQCQIPHSSNCDTQLHIDVREQWEPAAPYSKPLEACQARSIKSGATRTMIAVPPCALAALHPQGSSSVSVELEGARLRKGAKVNICGFGDKKLVYVHFRDAIHLTIPSPLASGVLQVVLAHLDGLGLVLVDTLARWLFGWPILAELLALQLEAVDAVP